MTTTTTMTDQPEGPTVTTPTAEAPKVAFRTENIVRLRASLPGGPDLVFLHDGIGETGISTFLHRPDDPTVPSDVTMLVTAAAGEGGFPRDVQVHVEDLDEATYAQEILTQLATTATADPTAEPPHLLPAAEGIANALAVFADALARRIDGQAWTITVRTDGRVLSQHLARDLAHHAIYNATEDPQDLLTEDEVGDDSLLEITLTPADPALPLPGAKWNRPDEQEQTA